MSGPHDPAIILVVDDDPGISRLISREVRREGHHAAIARSGAEAREWLRENRADLLLLDLKLPDVEAPELIRLLAEEGRSVPFVIITGQGDERVAVEMMKRGALDYMVKDVSFLPLVPTVVQRALARVEQQARLAAAEQALAQSHAELEQRVIERTSALEKSESRFRAFFENVGVGTLELGADGCFTQVNDRFCTITGYSREELLGGMTPLDLTGPEDATSLERVRKVLGGELASYETERRCVRKDGTEIWLGGTATTVFDENGHVRCIVGIAEDITDRVRAKDEIQQARSFAESTLEAIPASLTVLNAQGEIISTNRSWDAFAEANGGNLNAGGIGANYLAVCDAAAGEGVEEAARFATGIREVMNGEIPRFSMEYACHSPEQQRWFVGYVTPFSGNGPHSVVIAHVDVSERKRAEQVIRRLNAELETRVEQRTRQLQETNSALEEQIAARQKLEKEILHISEHEKQRIGQDLHDDLGQQLAGIWLLSDLLKASLSEKGSPEAEDAGKIATLLKDALALTRSLARGLHPVAVQAGGLAAALDELAARTSTMFRIECRCVCPEAVEMDNTTATHLYRIAQEAVTNAVKHGLAKKIDIELSSNPHHTVLSVKDEGKGGGAHHGDPSSKHRGMGLRIMRYRADMIGGVLDIKRGRSGTGTTVVCTIPTPHSHSTHTPAPWLKTAPASRPKKCSSSMIIPCSATASYALPHPSQA